jgi:hypothetical protein
MVLFSMKIKYAFVEIKVMAKSGFQTEESILENLL